MDEEERGENDDIQDLDAPSGGAGEETFDWTHPDAGGAFREQDSGEADGGRADSSAPPLEETPPAATDGGDDAWTYRGEDGDRLTGEEPQPSYEEDPDTQMPDGMYADEESGDEEPPAGMTQDELIESAEPSRKESPHENKAKFFNRSLTIKLLLFAFVALMLVFAVVIPLTRDDEGRAPDAELEKAGRVWLPAELRTEPERREAAQTEDFSGGNSATDTPDDAELAEKFPPPIGEQNPTPPAAETAPATRTTGGGTSAAPLTNRNEQQKALAHIPLANGAGAGGAQNGGNAALSANPYGPTGPYTPAALQENIESYLSLLQGNSADSYARQNDQAGKRQFMGDGAGAGGGYRWNAPNSLWKGTIIPAVLNTGINTDLPGMVTATVTENVHSSQDGRYLLIPQGSRLTATYNSSITFGQDRIQVAWDTLIRPDGLEVNLGNVPGADAQGFSGYTGWVSEHPFEYAKALGLIAVFSLLDTKAGNVVADATNTYAQNAVADTYREAQRLNNRVLERALDIQPTLSKLNGSKVYLIINVTMELPPIEPFATGQRYARE